MVMATEGKDQRTYMLIAVERVIGVGRNTHNVNWNLCATIRHFYLRAVGRKVLWSSACVCLCVCVSVCTLLSARYLKNRFMDHYQIWWVGAGSEPLEQVQFWC